MTPAIDIATANGIGYTVHEYQHDPGAKSYGEEAALKLGVAADQVFKTLVVETHAGELVVGVLPVSSQLNLKAIASAVSTKKVVLADKKKVQRVTGYMLGGVSPLGQKKHLTTVIDETAQCFDTIYISAGQRGLEIELNPGDLQRLTQAKYANISA